MSYLAPSLIKQVNPSTKEVLGYDGRALVDSSGSAVAEVVSGIPRFVKPEENYAESFGWQWKKWVDNQSESRGANVKQRQLILERTHFDKYPVEGKTILECGMGGGDDTEVLLTLPFAEIHSFDLSTSVERAQTHLNNSRLFISQASIYATPYPDESFDFVFCHRVLQHTPDPEKALRSICKKVKPGGILFAHSYKRSKKHMREWRYKYRWLTTRIPKQIVFAYVQLFGNLMHYFVHFVAGLGPRGEDLAYRFIPFYKLPRAGAYAVPIREAIELEKMITFDALTPKFDSPMSTKQFTTILTEEGFVIEYLEDRLASPIYATARKHFGATDRNPLTADWDYKPVVQQNALLGSET
jgi:2-polyprenyl-3-methyl-5-hydroxy-6-metoxy-1,4-benzoquinol methylase